MCFAVQEVDCMLVRAEGSIKSPLGRLIPDTTRLQLLLKTSANAGDLLLVAAGPQERVVCTPHMTTRTHHAAIMIPFHLASLEHPSAAAQLEMPRSNSIQP